MNKLFALLYILFLAFLSGCADEDDTSSKFPIHLTVNHKDLKHLSCIWNKAPHSAFTDLVEYNNSFYCCFREGNNHVPINKSDYGKIRILRSNDGLNWTSFALITNSNFDLRDPKLQVTPNNSLMLLMGAFNIIDGESVFKETLVSFADNELTANISFNNLSSINIGLDNYWLWRVVWYNGIAYGIAYDGNRWNKKAPYLLKSTDGLNYEIIAKLDEIGESNESDIQFIDDKMLVVIRNNDNNGFIGRASHPYTDWHWAHLNVSIDAPKIININNNIFVTGRLYGKQGLCYIKEYQQLIPFYILPSSGDCSYPGAIQVGNELWISYYSTSSNKSSVYLAKISIEKLLERVEIK